MKHTYIYSIYVVRGFIHTRGQDDIAFTVKGHIYDALDASSRLRSIGYSQVRFQKVGEETCREV